MVKSIIWHPMSNGMLLSLMFSLSWFICVHWTWSSQIVWMFLINTAAHSLPWFKQKSSIFKYVLNIWGQPNSIAQKHDTSHHRLTLAYWKNFQSCQFFSEASKVQFYYSIEYFSEASDGDINNSMPWLLLYWACHPSQGSESSLLQTQNIKGGFFCRKFTNSNKTD